MTYYLSNRHLRALHRQGKLFKRLLMPEILAHRGEHHTPMGGQYGFAVQKNPPLRFPPTHTSGFAQELVEKRDPPGPMIDAQTGEPLVRLGEG